MTSDFVVVPAPRGDFVELARTQSGRLFKKQILPAMGSQFVHPGNPSKKITVDETLAKALVANFSAGHADIVQVPIVNDQNHHVEDPLRNLGEVVDVTYDAKGVYVTIDARKKDQADELGKTLIGASAMFHLDYTDTKTGAKVGPTLLHTAITNRPYITNLDGFEEIVAASADTSGVPEFYAPAGAIPRGVEHTMGLDELLAELKEKHEIDVLDLQEQADSGKKELVTALSGVLREAGAVSLSAGDESPSELSVKDVADAVIELSQEKVALSETVAELKAESEKVKLSNAETEVDGLVKAGRILPTQRETMLRLSVEDRPTFDALLPEQPIVALSEVGTQVHDEPKSERFDAEIDRLSGLANKR